MQGILDKMMTSGGRLFNGISQTGDMPWTERATLMYLGAKLNPVGDLKALVTASISEISQAARLAERTVQYAIASLVAAGYLEKHINKVGAHQYQSNSYRILDKFFEPKDSTLSPEILKGGGRVLNACYGIEGLSGIQTMVLQRLSAKMDFRNFLGTQWIGLRKIAKDLSLSRSSVIRAIKVLVAKGLIECTQRFKRCKQIANEYRLKISLFEAFKKRRHEAREGTSHQDVEEAPLQPKEFLLPVQAPKSACTNNYGHIAEAMRIGSLVFSPASDNKKFVPQKAVEATMLEGLKRHGIEVLRKFKDEALKTCNVGYLKFDPNTVLGMLGDMAAERGNSA